MEPVDIAMAVRDYAQLHHLIRTEIVNISRLCRYSAGCFGLVPVGGGKPSGNVHARSDQSNESSHILAMRRRFAIVQSNASMF